MKPSPGRAEKWLDRAQRARDLAAQPGSPRPELLRVAAAYERLAARAMGREAPVEHAIDLMEE